MAKADLKKKVVLDIPTTEEEKKKGTPECHCTYYKGIRHRCDHASGRE